MRVWEMSFDFCLNIKLRILTPKPNIRLQFLDWKTNFEVTYFYLSFFILK